MKTILLILFLTVYTILNAQTPSWEWAKSAGGNNGDKSNYLAVDNLGNIYVTGYYDSPSITFGTYNFSNKGVFIVKYDKNGNILWAKSFGAGSTDQSYSVTTDASNNVYITGTFFSSLISFDAITLNNTSNPGFSDVYLVKLNTNGNVLWAHSMGGSNREFGMNVCTDNNENVYVTGCFYSPSMIIGAITLNNSGSQNLFLSKYDKSGNVVWARSASGSYADNGMCVASDNKGNIIIAGYFYSPNINFGGIILTNTTNNYSYDDMFIAKYDSLGTIIWAKSAGGDNYDYCTSITTDENDNIYAVGAFYSSSISFNTFTLSNSNAGKADLYLVKYDSSGNALWANSANGTDHDIAHSIAYRNGSLYMVGYFASQLINFGSFTLNNTSTGSLLSFDLFLVKYDHNGNIIWAKGFGGNGNDGTLGDEGPCAKTDNLGNIYVTGFYENSSIIFGTTTLTNQGSDDIFIAKINDAISPPVAIDSTCALGLETKLYPNPFHNTLIIQKKPTLCKVTLRIYNMIGQLMIKEKVINDGINNIPLYNLSSGNYYYQLVSDDKVLLSGKIMKQ